MQLWDRVMPERGDGKRVLITGGAGFIGRACLEPLVAAGYAVSATFHSERPTDAIPGVTWEKADLAGKASVADLLERTRPSHLLALAWYMGPGNQQASENFRWLQYSIDLLFSFAACGGERVVFCGSCMEYDWSKAENLHDIDRI